VTSVPYPSRFQMAKVELLGHADISLTLNVYSHVLPDMGDAAAGAMDAALG
jgi:integrase